MLKEKVTVTPLPPVTIDAQAAESVAITPIAPEVVPDVVEVLPAAMEPLVAFLRENAEAEEEPLEVVTRLLKEAKLGGVRVSAKREDAINEPVYGFPDVSGYARLEVARKDGLVRCGNGPSGEFTYVQVFPAEALIGWRQDDIRANLTSIMRDAVTKMGENCERLPKFDELSRITVSVFVDTAAERYVAPEVSEG